MLVRQIALVRRGFTLIELIVVMAIVALLASIAAPRYFASVDRARANSLRASLQVMRGAIDHFVADKARYPESLQELVDARYLRQIPEDPLTSSVSTWLALAPPAELETAGQVFDVRSGKAGRAADGSLYAEW
ncbi:type II secretion system protein [Roseateles oligotrophus]|uniref:Type II secretion system GspH family protein n=1 Tax=Roseateles oligotrophus TaxID=1769250 RepID=A0ABT2YAK7_9BURK|nr:type II secretion system GspH family protein [Roseateles oligotrophus]MCV2367308.1 type II secretion system GspH family protein [Roseateles oligotrophus]